MPMQPEFFTPLPSDPSAPRPQRSRTRIWAWRVFFTACALTLITLFAVNFHTYNSPGGYARACQPIGAIKQDGMEGEGQDCAARAKAQEAAQPYIVAFLLTAGFTAVGGLAYLADRVYVGDRGPRPARPSHPRDSDPA